VYGEVVAFPVNFLMFNEVLNRVMVKRKELQGVIRARLANVLK